MAGTPPALHAVLDEMVLYREIGGPQVMNDQLNHLTECVSEKLTVQIVPSDVNPSRSVPSSSGPSTAARQRTSRRLCVESLRAVTRTSPA
ncbi:MAG: Scr1 family TA system antitoxin-like transcriptional regulator [Gaiellaceae bacterium]